MITVQRFEGGYGRNGEVRMGEGICDVCQTLKLVIDADASEGEYASITLCFQCVSNWFSTYSDMVAKDEQDRAEAYPLGYAQGLLDSEAGSTSGKFTRWSPPPTGHDDNWRDHYVSGQMEGARVWWSEYNKNNPR